MPGPALVMLNKIYKPFFSTQYTVLAACAANDCVQGFVQWKFGMKVSNEIVAKPKLNGKFKITARYPNTYISCARMHGCDDETKLTQDTHA